MAAARVVRHVLGTDVVGGYLHGSAVLGGLRPHSDVDVFAVVRRRTSEGERRALVEGLLEISGEKARLGPARPVELTVVVQDDIRPWRYPPRREFQYGEWLRDAYERGETPSPAPDPDLAPLITMVLLGDTALFGPPPADVLDPVPTADLRRALAAGVPDLLAELELDTRNVVLTLARIWTTLETGLVQPKDAAADWALARLPAEHRPVLARARAGYLGQQDEHWDDLLPRLRPYAEYVAGVIDRTANGSPSAPAPAPPQAPGADPA
ncbi:aminoglycoside adenylyltransferase family protein [Streptomyces sp. CA-250714]|uniref:aminoglycoside adenylyltransferase family protein n=1 Tax=Streptomyces sp. CA-250714 TaxID=3240060 RepID=UPI003D91D4F0